MEEKVTEKEGVMEKVMDVIGCFAIFGVGLLVYNFIMVPILELKVFSDYHHEVQYKLDQRKMDVRGERTQAQVLTDECLRQNQVEAGRCVQLELSETKGSFVLVFPDVVRSHKKCKCTFLPPGHESYYFEFPFTKE
jgi:hypothetical protein